MCIGAHAEQITINWNVDNQIYTTTTCEVGGDVVLPPVSKRGHIFKGWIAEHFNRGTFTNWDNVPNKASWYIFDINNNQTPLEGDYIIVEDSYYCDKAEVESDFFDVTIYPLYKGNKVDVIYQGVKTTISFPADSFSNFLVGPNNDISISQDSVNGISISAKYKVKIDGKEYKSGTCIECKGNRYLIYSYRVFFPPRVYSGTWKFVYHGIWESDGKNGWTPVEQIGE